MGFADGPIGFLCLALICFVRGCELRSSLLIDVNLMLTSGRHVNGHALISLVRD
jgi:hypothetical protein